MILAPNQDNPILFFDGQCNLCNGAVQFVVKHDKVGKVKFATLQSDAGAKAKAILIKQTGTLPDSLILLANGVYHTHSSAALKLAGYLDGSWKYLKVLHIFPQSLRDTVYKFIAANRYKWWGKKNACMIPTPELKSRFLD